jgi:hypothetical protein
MRSVVALVLIECLLTATVPVRGAGGKSLQPVRLPARPDGSPQPATSGRRPVTPRGAAVNPRMTTGRAC